MWNFADDQGYMDFSLKRIKMQVFPGDDVDVSRALARLHEFGLIRLWRAPEGSLVIHLVNWDKHQRISNPSRARFTPGDLQEEPFPKDTLASPLEPSVVLGKGREGKGNSCPPTADAAEDEPDLFADFYAAYPRKEARRSAEKAWAAAIKRGADPADILVGLRSFKFADERRFIPLPASWLNADRWADSNVRDLRPADPHAGMTRQIQTESGRWREVYEDEVLYGQHTEWRRAL
jgi:hypothetical protein